jgi:hypothetical protein
MFFGHHSQGASNKVSSSRQRAPAGRRPLPLALELLEVRNLLSGAAAAAYGQLPLAFEPNVGQTDARVQFMAHGGGYAIFLTGSEAVLSLLSPAQGSAGTTADILGIRLVGAGLNPQAQAGDRLPGVSNYLNGNNPAAWQTNIPTYADVTYSSVYAGINLTYHGLSGQLEYDFAIAPGANPGVIRLEVGGATSIALDAQGNLVLQTGDGKVVEKAPVTYQEINGIRQIVSSAYVLEPNGQVGFALGAYDHSQTLVIDPVLSYSTYLGGSNNDSAAAIAVDGNGNAYITGVTSSTDFPTVNPFQGTSHRVTVPGDSEAFVTKLNASGTAIVYSTYLGGTGPDSGTGIAVDSAGDAYIVGTTGSSDFPTTANAFQGSGGIVQHAFVTKLNPAGNALLYSSYFGDSSNSAQTLGAGIAADNSGNAYITGSTAAQSFFPVTFGSAFQTLYGGGTEDAFVAKLNTNASGFSSLVYSSYLGGSGDDQGNGIAIDGFGNAYVTGTTASSDFPTAGNAFQTASGGSNDAFLAKVSPTGATLTYSTYLGGSNFDVGFGVAVDGTGHAYVAGETFSSNFPTLNAFQRTQVGTSGQAFVAKLDPAAAAGTSSLVYSTYLGGSAFVNFATAIAVDANGVAHITGQTNSTDFPTANAIQPNLDTSAGAGEGGFNVDAFVTALNATGSGLIYSTYLGGAGNDGGAGIAVDASGSTYIAGFTDSSNFPTANPLQASMKAGAVGSAFVTKIALAAPTITSLNPTSVNEGSPTFTLTVNGTGFVDGSTVQWNGQNLQTTFVSTTQLQATVPAALVAEEGSASVTVNNAVPGEGVSNAATFTITDAPLTDTTPVATLNAVEGIGTAQVVATFSDANPGATINDFANTTIDWGDGTTTNGAVQLVGRTATGATFQVMGGHVYAEEGSFNVIVTVNDVGGQSVSTSHTHFAVADAALTDTTPVSTRAITEGQNTGTSVVATFSDANTGATVSDFANTVIHWGDGTTSTGTVQLVSRGEISATFEVLGSHAYALSGNETVTVDIHDVGGQSATTSNTHFQVLDASLIDLSQQQTLPAMQGVDTGSVVLARFLDQNVLAQTSNFSSVTVNWGDGATSAGTVQLVSQGSTGTTFQVVGNHTYNRPGTFTVQVSVQDVGGQSLTSSRTVFEVPPRKGQLSVALGANGFVLFVVTADHSLFRHEDTTGWVQIGGTGTVQSVSAAPETSGNIVAFVVTTGNGLARFDSQLGWSALGAPGTISTISAGRDAGGRADVFVLTTDGTFTEFSGTSGWRTSPLGAPGTIASISAVTGGRVYVVTTSHAVATFADSTGWSALTGPGFASSLDTVDDGLGNVTVFAVGVDGSLFRQAGTSSFMAIGGPGTIRTVSGGEDVFGQADVFAIATDTSLAEFSNAGGWMTIGAPGTIDAIAGVSNGRVYAIGTDGSVVGHDDQFGWFTVAGPGFAEL